MANSSQFTKFTLQNFLTYSRLQQLYALYVHVLQSSIQVSKVNNIEECLTALYISKYGPIKYYHMYFLQYLHSLTKCLINTFVETQTELHGPCINRIVILVVMIKVMS